MRDQKWGPFFTPRCCVMPAQQRRGCLRHPLFTPTRSTVVRAWLAIRSGCTLPSPRRLGAAMHMERSMGGARLQRRRPSFREQGHLGRARPGAGDDARDGGQSCEGARYKKSPFTPPLPDHTHPSSPSSPSSLPHLAPRWSSCPPSPPCLPSSHSSSPLLLQVPSGPLCQNAGVILAQQPG